jgi:hypothetical protein
VWVVEAVPVEPIVDVPVVPDVVVEVVPVVEVALVFVIIVPDVSVEVPDGIAEVEVEALVSVDAVVLAAVSVDDEVTAVSVALTFSSFLHPKAKSTRAVTHRTARVFFITFPFKFSEIDLWSVSPVAISMCVVPSPPATFDNLTSPSETVSLWER